MTDGYLNKGPPNEFLEGLVSSGLVKDRGLLPSIAPSKSPQKSQKVNRVPISKPISSYASNISITNKQKVSIAGSKSCQFESIFEEIKSPSDASKQSSMNLSKYTKFSLPPEREAVTMPNFSTNPKTSHCTRSQSQSLLKAHNQRIEQVSSSEHASPSEFEKKQLFSYLLSFDEAIQATKTYNSEIALILVKVKNYFQNLYSHLPELTEKYEMEIHNIENNEKAVLDKNQCLQEEIIILNDMIDSLKKEITGYKTNKSSLEIKINQLEEIKADLEYKNVEQKQRLDEVSYRLTKIDEMRSQYQANLMESEKQVEELTKLQYENEIIINEFKNSLSKQQKELEILREDNTKTHKELNNANQELQKYQRCRYVDVGTEPTEQVTKKRNKSTKKSEGISLAASSSMSTSSTNIGLVRSPSSIRTRRGSINLTSQNNPFDIPSDNSIMDMLNGDGSTLSLPVTISENPFKVEVVNNPKGKGKKKGKQRKAEKPKEIKIQETNKGKEIEEEKQKSTEVEKEKEKEKEEEEEEETEIEIEDSEDDDISSGEIYTEEKLPPGYKVVELFDIPTITSCVGQIFSIPDPSPSSLPSVNRKFKHDEKTFMWTLRRVIGILKDGIEATITPSTTFKDIVRSLLEKEYNNEKIVDRVEADLWLSVFTYRPKSMAIQFFMDMAGEVFNILDFRYFNIIFSLAFQHIYPKVEEALGQIDIDHDFGLFLIHRDYIRQLAELTLKTTSLSEEAIAIIEGSHPNPMYPNMVSFWVASRALIGEFRSTHKRFHQISRNLLLCVGWSESKFVCKPHFTAATRMLLPHDKGCTIESMWQFASVGDHSKTPDTISRLNFLKAIGESKGMAQEVLELPLCEDYERRINALGEPMAGLFFFLRSRFTDFLPQFVESLPADVGGKLYRLIERIRNALLWVDIPSALLYYRTLLQHTDLRMTERSPVTQFGSTVTLNDTERVENHLKMRECLAMLRVGGEDPSEELLIERKELLDNIT